MIFFPYDLKPIMGALSRMDAMCLRLYFHFLITKQLSNPSTRKQSVNYPTTFDALLHAIRKERSMGIKTKKLKL
jgi:hypothetical protein